jgi:hypothetical protein
MKPTHSPGPPMTLGNMRQQGVQHLICYCLNDACRHTALSKYPDDVGDDRSGEIGGRL